MTKALQCLKSPLLTNSFLHKPFFATVKFPSTFQAMDVDRQWYYSPFCLTSKYTLLLCVNYPFLKFLTP